MTMRTIGRGIAWALIACLLSPAACLAKDDPGSPEPSAFAAAVDRVAPSVVRIETIGGVERIGQTLLGTGPTTGVIVDPAGYVVSSAFNFINRPSSILVRLADGTRKPATLVATDRSRMIVLLKIETAGPLPVCEIVPRAEMRVGEWAIAVGRAFDTDRPNMAVGILSALDRVWGKAIQTDAAVSPNNYGGPLIDIRGRVLGILVPLAPEATDEMAGLEWYDSGIGFAIPAEHIRQILPQWKQGENLGPGMMGISIQGPNLYTGEPIIIACRPRSPAAAAGIQPGDRIVEMDGRNITRAAEIKEEIGRRYAGQKMRVVVLRDGKRVPCDVTLAANLDPYQHGFLGVLPMRDSEKSGVAVRYVYPDSPAAKAGIAPGDVLASVGGKPVEDRLAMQLQIGGHEPGEEIEVTVRHGGAARTVKVALASLPEDLPPAELPPAHRKIEPVSGKPKMPTGAMPMQIAEFANEIWAYMPRGCAEDVPHGVVVWLHAPSEFDWQALLTRWKPLCDRYDLIFIAPKATDADGWTLGDLPLVNRLLAQVVERYAVDPARVVVCGQESGGTLAMLAAFRNREFIRAAAAIDAAPKGQPPENEPPYRTAVYAATASKSRSAKPIDAAISVMRKLKIPVTEKSLGELPRPLDADEVSQLVRWIDMLDRL